jgi:hypothetical protein
MSIDDKAKPNIMCLGNVQPRDVDFFDCKNCPIDHNQKYKPCYVKLEVPQTKEEEPEAEFNADYRIIMEVKK